MTNTPFTPSRTTQLTSPAPHFTMRFSATPRVARLSRRLAGERLAAWGIPYASEPHDAVTLIVGELAANAVQHGRVPGRDFRLLLTVADGSVRAEVADTRAEHLSTRTPHPYLSPDADGGRGLVLVAALATTWGWRPRIDGPGKTVWAAYAIDTPPFFGQA
ncbi:ATP-binding protein [Streptomyces gardneri]|uniref:ATP-binding protein n=1 Tax=Streptomyces gardneri TaxID=66892 RepID=UPI0035D73B20